MPLAHAHKLFITFSLTIRISGVAVHVLRYEKEIFAQQCHSGKKETTSVTLLGLRVHAKEITVTTYGRVEYVRDLELTARQMIMYLICILEPRVWYLLPFFYLLPNYNIVKVNSYSLYSSMSYRIHDIISDNSDTPVLKNVARLYNLDS